MEKRTHARVENATAHKHTSHVYIYVYVYMRIYLYSYGISLPMMHLRIMEILVIAIVKWLRFNTSMYIDKKHHQCVKIHFAEIISKSRLCTCNANGS